MLLHPPINNNTMIDYIQIWLDDSADDGNVFCFELSCDGNTYDGRFNTDTNGSYMYDWYNTPINWEVAEDVVSRYFDDYYSKRGKQVDVSIINEIESGDFDFVTIPFNDNANFPLFFPCKIYGK